MIKTLYKKQDGDLLVITGHFSRQELKALQQDGYRLQEPQVNKHGIRAVSQ